jgi:hypothetical protein
MSILNGPVGVTGMAPQQAPVPERSELELANDFLDKLEGGTIPLPLLHCVASIAVSAKRIADKLESIDRNIGQGSNLQHMQGIKQALDGINTDVGNISSGIFQGVNAKAKALEDELRRMRGY